MRSGIGRKLSINKYYNLRKPNRPEGRVGDAIGFGSGISEKVKKIGKGLSKVELVQYTVILCSVDVNLEIYLAQI